MKKHTFLLCCLSLLIFSCSDDDETNLLSFDTANITGPFLEAATWEAAARFTPAETSEFTGLRLTQVEYFIGNDVPEATIIVYGPGINNEPGAILYQANIENSIAAGVWNDHRIATPIDITGQEIWISFRLLHDFGQSSIGCDAGPANPNGDWLFSSIDNQWITFSDRTGESVNWNIRGVVEE